MGNELTDGSGAGKEDLRAYAARMVELEKIKSDFLNLAAHELRGPLAVLGGYLAMLEDGSLGELTPQMKRILPVCSAKAAHMAGLVEQMLEVARLEDAHLHLNLERVDLRQPVRAAVGSVGGLAQPGQAVRIRCPATAVWAQADRSRIETVVTNLLDNAIKYSPAGGDIHVSLHAIGDEAVVRVADRGLGIAREDVGRLFTRFGRIVTPENQHLPGTGLALYLAKQVAELHSGRLAVAGRRGGGTCFSLHVPQSLG